MDSRERLLRFIREQGLIPPGAAVTCAVSGGADSMALLALLLELRETLEITVSAAHFDHRLRGEESDGDARFVRDWCAERQIPFTCGSGDVAAESGGKAVEETARKMRYAFLESLPGLIATAHNADDNAETVLMNLLRGTGLRGLGGIPPKRGRIVRPLLCLTREEVLAVLRERDIPWREDSSNRSDDYRRNRLRHQVLPLLREENPAFSETVLSASLRLRAENEYLESLTDEAVRNAARDGGWDCAALCALPEALRHRAVCAILGQSADAAHAEAVMALLERPAGRTGLPGDLQAVKAHGLLRLEPNAPEPPWEPVMLPVPGEVTIPALGLRAEARILASEETPPDDAILLSAEAVRDAILLRPRKTGDSLLLPGGRRSLKRLMIDRGVPARQRDSLPVLCAGERVLAVCLIGTDRELLPAPGGSTLAIQFTKQTKEEEITR